MYERARADTSESRSPASLPMTMIQSFASFERNASRKSSCGKATRVELLTLQRSCACSANRLLHCTAHGQLRDALHSCAARFRAPSTPLDVIR